MIDLEKKLLGLLPEIEQRRNWCFFPERCYEVGDEDGFVVTSYWWGSPSRAFQNGVEVSDKVKGVVKLTYMVNHRIQRLGKDSRKAVWEAFQDLDSDLRLVSCWTGLESDIGVGSNLIDYLTIYLQYSPVKR